MKMKPIHLLFYGLVGAVVGLGSNSITQWGKATPLREGINISLTVICLIIVHIIWYKYIRHDEALNRKTNKRAGNPIVLWVALAIGITISSLVLNMQ